MQRQAALHSPIDHHAVEFFERMSDIAKQHKAAQHLASAEVFFELFLPLIFNAQRHFGEAVARQVDQKAALGQTEKIDQLRASWRFRDAGKARLIGDRVNSARFACVGAAREGNFG